LHQKRPKRTVRRNPRQATLDSPSQPVEIGPRIRAARESLGISLRSLAERSGFSASFLSQVELGQSSPSLASLQRITDALELDLAELLRRPESRPPTPVVRRGERQSLRSEWSRASAESLLPDGNDERFGAWLLALDPGGRTGTIERRRGVREFAYCVRGRVALTLGAARHELGPGDSAVLGQFSAAWENIGKLRAEILIVSAKLG
jgi:XRE family transcriptional regulator, regulator of sulfur utilization